MKTLIFAGHPLLYVFPLLPLQAKSQDYETFRSLLLRFRIRPLPTEG